jgi:hypothetical protein
MYPIARHYTEKANIERMEFIDSGMFKQDLATVLENVPCHVQPLTDRDSGDITGGFGKEYQMFCDVVDIQEGDRITIGTRVYRAMGIEKHVTLRRNRHMEIRLRIHATD